MYPECHSVFGCHDVFKEELTGKIEYEVMGWYHNSDDDFLKKFVKAYSEKEVNKKLQPNEQSTDITAAIQTAFRISFEKGNAVPENLFCYGRLVIEQNMLAKSSDSPPTIEKISFGNTGTEALAALLSGGDIRKEKQLEAIRLMSRIGNRRLDLHAKFEEAFHENGFTPTDGGMLWAIEKEIPTNAPAVSVNSVEKTNYKQPPTNSASIDVSLPDGFAHLINKLNQLQQQFNLALDEYRDLKQQLFSDWYKFMMADHHTYMNREELGDIDEIRFFYRKYQFY
jgi:hypothetical protein